VHFHPDDQPDGPQRPFVRRPRAAAIRSNNDSWDRLYPSLQAQLITGSSLSEQKHKAMVNSGQQYLQQLLSQDGWCCSHCLAGRCRLPEGFVLFPGEATNQRARDNDSDEHAPAVQQGGSDDDQPMAAAAQEARSGGDGDQPAVAAAAQTFSNAHMAPVVLMVDRYAHSRMAVPTAPCDFCGEQQQLQPEHVLAVPATPVQPTVFYTYDLLEEACHWKLYSPIGVSAFCETYHRIHAIFMPASECCTVDHVWRNFGAAFERFRVIWTQQQEPQYFGFRNIRGDGADAVDCPGCWRSAVAANADACLAFTRLRKAAKCQRDRLPLHGGLSMFLDCAKLKENCEKRRGFRPPEGLLEEGPCDAQFKAAKEMGRRMTAFEEHGGLCYGQYFA
jgi:hypothetical protein